MSKAIVPALLFLGILAISGEMNGARRVDAKATELEPFLSEECYAKPGSRELIKTYIGWTPETLHNMTELSAKLEKSDVQKSMAKWQHSDIYLGDPEAQKFKLESEYYASLTKKTEEAYARMPVTNLKNMCGCIVGELNNRLKDSDFPSRTRDKSKFQHVVAAIFYSTHECLQKN